LAGFPAFQHLVANPLLTIDGDTASGRTMCFNPMVSPSENIGDQNVFFCGLWYLDTFVRTEEGWKFTSRSEEKSFTYNMSGAFR
ncbi:MAG: nuclear transport factor 2 family protein, partial [Actinobacteria bacterium]|nr:nuclear transport factor 2 family protein [Actinomycetota bacterium]